MQDHTGPYVAIRSHIGLSGKEFEKYHWLTDLVRGDVTYRETIPPRNSIEKDLIVKDSIEKDWSWNDWIGYDGIWTNWNGNDLFVMIKNGLERKYWKGKEGKD